MRQLDYVARLIRFALKENPLLYFSVLVSLFSVVIELLTLASLFPLLQIASTGMVPKEGLVVKGLGVMGVAASGQVLLWTFVTLFGIRLVTLIGSSSPRFFVGIAEEPGITEVCARVRAFYRCIM